MLKSKNIITAVIILAHGSKEQHIKRVVVALAKKLSLCFSSKSLIVSYAFLQFNKPSFEEIVKRIFSKNNPKKIIILPLFVSHGRHTLYDIPKIINNIKRKYRRVSIKLALPLGSDAYLVKLLYKRYKEVV